MRLRPEDLCMNLYTIAMCFRDKIGWEPIEHIEAMYFDRHGVVIHPHPVRIASGTEDQCRASWKEVFDQGWKKGAHGVVIAHNHPGASRLGQSKPDESFTLHMRRMGGELGIPVIDHLIVGPCPGYFSFTEAGLL